MAGMNENICYAKSSPTKALVWITLSFFAGFAGVSAYGPIVAQLKHSMALSPMMMGLLASCPALTGPALAQLLSKRSRFITLFHAATKSCTNFCCPSDEAYTSATARSSAFDPNTRSTGDAVHLSAPVLRSRPS